MYAKFENIKNNTVEFSLTPPYILRRLTAETNVNLYDSKGLGQDGSTYLGNTLDNKEIVIEGSLHTLDRSEHNLELLREKIITIFNPKLGQGNLYFRGRKIKCIIKQLPVFNDDNLEFMIPLVCHEPYWTSEDMKIKEVAQWSGNFHFPLVIPQDEGIMMGYREPSLIVHIENEGQVSTGMIIEFTANGIVKNPSLFNINTRNSIKINKTMERGEKIIVNTNFGSKSVKSILGNVTKDCLNYIDILGGGDTFLQLDVGDNLFRYDAEENLDNLEVKIKYYNRYLGV